MRIRWRRLIAKSWLASRWYYRRQETAVPIPVILDCDPGTDDALALFLALASPELDVLAVTAVGGNVGLELHAG